jgi:AraC-like DNA-binding protein
MRQFFGWQAVKNTKKRHYQDTAGKTSGNSIFIYLPYSEEDEKLGMICTNAGSVEVLPGAEYPPDRDKFPVNIRSVTNGRVLKEFQLVYISKGKGSLEVHEKSYQFNQGCAFLTIPGIFHRYRPLFETGWHEYWVGFKGSFFEGMMDRDILSTEKMFFKPGLNNRIIELFRLVLEEVKDQKPLYQFRSCSVIISLIAEIFTAERRRTQPNYYQKIVEQAKIIMEKNCFGSINISSICRQVGISVPRLNEIFKTYTSMTPYQYYIHIKIEKAQRLLEEKDVSVKEAAYRLGFDDQYYFSRLFKNKTGFTPAEWKR